MEIGCCTNMMATKADGIGAEYLEGLARAGFDFVELPVAETNALDDEAFRELVSKVEASGLRCTNMNNFFPASYRLTGPDADEAAAVDFIERALERAAALGAEYVGFGSGAARRLPAGFPRENGLEQLAALLRKMGAIAKKNGLVILIEPLRQAECNVVNTFAEGCALAERVNDAHVLVMSDYYHLAHNKEDVGPIAQLGKAWLRHLHIASFGRRFPRRGDRDDYASFAAAVKQAGYGGRLSIEAQSDDFEGDAAAALPLLRELFA